MILPFILTFDPYNPGPSPSHRFPLCSRSLLPVPFCFLEQSNPLLFCVGWVVRRYRMATARLIESIREIRVVRQFLVKWKNRPEEDNTWINENELINMHNLAVAAATGDSSKMNDQRSSVSIQSPTVSDANREFSIDTASSEQPRASRRKSRTPLPARRTVPLSSHRKRRTVSPESPTQGGTGERGARAKSVFGQRGVKKTKKGLEVKSVGRKACGKSVSILPKLSSSGESSGNGNIVSELKRIGATSTPVPDTESDEEGGSQSSVANLDATTVKIVPSLPALPSFASIAATKPIAEAFSSGSPGGKHLARRSILMEKSRSPSKAAQVDRSQSQSLNDGMSSSIVSNEVPEPAVGPRIPRASAERPARRAAGRPSAQKKRPSTSRGKKQALPQYEVENVLGAKWTGTETWYLVQWKGYNSPDDNTWEDQYSMKDARDRVKEFENVYGIAGHKVPLIMSPEGETAEKLRTIKD
ncbi:hypothetical protein RvY_02419 [Ramazzottius varieornatus]|uniref:Chromo domain-containing protein n=1 Tax=Ramazzottius varieornatus TaxID=947166 RepID=A0A1D1URQ5_RAMVA|nr:hypothetical protein RvY_02419 [Ramazzottius varieornatus]